MKYLYMIVGFVLLVSFLYLLVNPTPSNEGPEYSMICYTGEDIQEIREEWVRSENITSYEDLPKNQTENLPQRIKESLKADASYWLTAVKYSNLSEDEKDVFRRGINGTRISRDESIGTLVLYEGSVYYCDTDRYTEGA
jgi:23S rRNA maturation mini-RNase III